MAILCILRVFIEENVDSTWLNRNDTIQTPAVLHTPQLTSTVMRENPRQAAEHNMEDQESERGSESDFVQK